MQVFYNGQFMPAEQVSIGMEDRGYQFADGIYEVVRVYNNRLFHLKPHMERLARSAAGIELDLPWALDELAGAMRQLVDANQPGDGYVYLQITRGVAPRNHPFPTQPEPVVTMYTKVLPRPTRNLEQGVACVTVDDDRWLRCNIKSVSLLPNVLAKQKAARAGVYEAIFVRDGRVTEGSSSNIFCVYGDTIQTHPANNLILGGITRQALIRLVRQEGFRLLEEPFSVPGLLAADEAIVSSTTSEVTPIVQVDGHPIGDGRPGRVTRALQAAFEAEIRRETGA
ncbi:MAG: D-amino-acid transaminase [Bacillota bacterium]